MEVPQDAESAEIFENFDRFCLEIQEKIFEFLPVDDRKTAALTCKRWLEILSFPKFAKGCPLVLDFCKFGSPAGPAMSIFLHTAEYRQFPYVEINTVYKYQKECARTMTNIGRYTTHLKLGWNFESSLLNYFPNLKHLTVPRVNHVDDILPDTVESLHVEEIHESISMSTMEKLSKMENLQSITADWFKLQAKTDDVIAKRKTLDHLFRMSDELVGFMNQQDENGDEFITRIGSNINILKKTPIELHNVTKIICGGIFPDLNEFKKLVNLNELKYDSRIDKDVEEDEENRALCFFFHEKFKMPKLTILSLPLIQEICDKCFATTLQSFPNLMQLEILSNLSTAQFKEILRNCRGLKILSFLFFEFDSQIFRTSENKNEPNIGWLTHLECLKIVDRSYDYIDESDEEAEGCKLVLITDSIVSNWPKMSNLKILKFGDALNLMPPKGAVNLTEFSCVNFANLTHQCPNITQFTARALCFSDDDIRCFSENWPNLKSLSLEWVGVGNITYKMFESLAQYCKKLETLRLSTLLSFPIDSKEVFWEFDLYDEILTLRGIEIIEENGCHITISSRDSKDFEVLY